MVDRNVRDLYDKYRRHEISRRQFLERLAIVAGGIAAAYAMLPLLENNLAYGGLVAADDGRLTTEQVTYPGEDGEIHGYLARPKDAAGLPGVVVIHENRGLTATLKTLPGGLPWRVFWPSRRMPCRRWADRPPIRRRRSV